MAAAWENYNEKILTVPSKCNWLGELFSSRSRAAENDDVFFRHWNQLGEYQGWMGSDYIWQKSLCHALYFLSTSKHCSGLLWFKIIFPWKHSIAGAGCRGICTPNLKTRVSVLKFSKVWLINRRPSECKNAFCSHVLNICFQYFQTFDHHRPRQYLATKSIAQFGRCSETIEFSKWQNLSCVTGI